jgi:hypothetical protein
MFSRLQKRETRGRSLSSGRSMLMALYWSKVLLPSSNREQSAELKKHPRSS